MTAPSQEPVENAYSPPAAVDQDEHEHEHERKNKRPGYKKQVRSVAVMVLLMVVTVGLYETIWYVRRAEFLDSRRAREKVGVFPAVLLMGHIMVLAISFIGGATSSQDAMSIANLLSLAVSVPAIVLRFRVAGILRTDFRETGRDLHVSGFGTFFLGSLYLQYKMNRAAEIPRRRPA